MIIKPLISIALLGILLLSLSQRHIALGVRLAIYAALALGLIFTWAPDLTNVIAQALGVGRGADLLFYLWILISMLMLLMSYLSLQRMNERITELTRSIALLDAKLNDAGLNKKDGGE